MNLNCYGSSVESFSAVITFLVWHPSQLEDNEERWSVRCLVRSFNVLCCHQRYHVFSSSHLCAEVSPSIRNTVKMSKETSTCLERTRSFSWTPKANTAVFYVREPSTLTAKCAWKPWLIEGEDTQSQWAVRSYPQKSCFLTVSEGFG